MLFYIYDKIKFPSNILSLNILFFIFMIKFESNIFF